MTFKVGDEVTLSTRAGSRAVVEYGPYGPNGDIYLVKLLEGDEQGEVFGALARVMSTPVFRQGDRVAGFGGTEYSIVAGPFTAHDTWYVVKDDKGQHHPHGDDRLTLVSRAPKPVGPTYELDGVTYDLGARYRDKDGDVWRFEVINGEPRGGMNGKDIYGYSETLAEVQQDYGPLIKL
ncbi:phiSA1p31-related protein [Streptomyces sp. NPDC091259]|uniref:phiSA1p31-related protein n=1 Tax=Streptomyces sp. NPDC091259 TaxID=3365976 RepID=UPI00380BA86E